jgi:hypothetical protein
MDSNRARNRRLFFLALLGGAVLIWNQCNPPAPSAGTGTLVPIEKATNKLNAANATYERLGAELEAMEPRILKMSYNLPAEQLEPRFVRDIQKIAARANVHLREIKPLRPRLIANGEGAKVPLEIRFQAVFHPQVIRFLYYLENPAGKIVIDKLNLTTADSKARTVDVTAQVSVFTRSTTGIAGAPSGEKPNVPSKTG